MKERLHHQLHPETQKALKMAQRLVGKEPIIRRVDHLPQNTRALLKRPFVPYRPYEISYRRGEERVVDHLITHEVGHIVRLHRVPESERLAASVSQEERRNAALQIRDEFIPLLALGVSPETIGAMMIDWHEALAVQLANFPADLRIEQWIFERFAGLRNVQELSLTQEVHRGYESLVPMVADVVPPSIYKPTVAMNAAQAWHVAKLFQKPQLVEPFAEEGYAEIAEQLTREVLEAPDLGHRSDLAATDRLAQRLKLTGWYEWLPFEDSR
jgi:hypothetical protein